MGNPVGIALFSFMASQMTGDSRWRVLILAGVVSGVVIIGSIGIVRYGNRSRQITPAIVDASRNVMAIPDSMLVKLSDPEGFISRRDEFARKLAEGALPVDSVRVFYQSYALWMRDGQWDSEDINGLAQFIGSTSSP